MGEVLIVQMAEAIAINRIGRAIPERITPGESFGNDIAEEAGKNTYETL